MYLNKLLILKKLQQANAHLGLALVAKNSKWYRFSGQRHQSYIFGFRSRYAPIIDLDKTIISLRRACNVIQLIIRSNGHLLFVNTNPNYNKIIQQTAKYTNQSFINHKWIGGFLTNWNHMRNVQEQFSAAAKLSKVCQEPKQSYFNLSGAAEVRLRSNTKARLWRDTGARRDCLLRRPFVAPVGATSEPYERPDYGLSQFERFACIRERGATKEPYKEQYSKRASDTNPTTVDAVHFFERSIASNPRYKKMQKCFEGLSVAKNAYPNSVFASKPYALSGPDCVVIFNATQNSTAIYEAHLNQIPIISIVDSNVPNELYNLITYPIPANYESVQFIYLFCNCILKTILASR